MTYNAPGGTGGVSVIDGTVTAPVTGASAIAAPSSNGVSRYTFSAAAGSFTSSLPDATTCAGASLQLYKAASDTSNNPVYFTLFGGQLVDNQPNASQLALVGGGHFFDLFSDGVTWRVENQTTELFVSSFAAGSAGDGKGSTYTASTAAPNGAPNSSNDYWWDSNGGAYFFAGGGGATPGTWTGIAASGVWQGAAASSFALGGGAGAWTLTAVLNAAPQSANCVLGVGGYFICGASAGGTNWNRGPSNAATGPVWTITGWNAATKTLTATSTFAGSLVAPPATLGTVVLCTSSAGLPDVYPAPVDLGTGLLLATVAVPPSGLLEFQLDWRGYLETFTNGSPGWMNFFDVTNGLYLTGGQNSSVGSGTNLSIGDWSVRQVANSSGVNGYNKVLWVPGTVIQFRPIMKYINTYASNATGGVIFQDSSPQTFSVRTPNR